MKFVALIIFSLQGGYSWAIDSDLHPRAHAFETRAACEKMMTKAKAAFAKDPDGIIQMHSHVCIDLGSPDKRPAVAVSSANADWYRA